MVTALTPSGHPTQRDLEALAARIGDALVARDWRMATAESCTGGWVGQALTAVAGSSRWFECGFITYSNQSKAAVLGVGEDVLRVHGAVSEAAVRAMAEGALRQGRADVAVAISGIAGPSGATADKPVGTVWFAWAGKAWPTTASCRRFDGDREQVRLQAVDAALLGVWERLRGPG